MDIGRAIQIVDSDTQIDVVFEGESVWIDNVDPDTRKVTVHSIRTGDSKHIDVDRLHEPQ